MVLFLHISLHSSFCQRCRSFSSRFCAYCVRMRQSFRGGPHIFPSSLFFITCKDCLETGVRHLLSVRHVYKWGPRTLCSLAWLPSIFHSFSHTGHPVDSCGPAEARQVRDWRSPGPGPQPAGPGASPGVCGNVQTVHREALPLPGPQQQGMQCKNYRMHDAFVHLPYGKNKLYIENICLFRKGTSYFFHFSICVTQSLLQGNDVLLESSCLS